MTSLVAMRVYAAELKNLTHPLCIASVYYCYYPGTLDVHSLLYMGTDTRVAESM